MKSIVFLHGIGQTAEVWMPVIDALPLSLRGVAVPFDFTSADFSLATAAEQVRRHMDLEGIGRAHVCGLSLGAMAGIRLAVDSPERVESLVLSGAQVHPHPVLMAVQNAIMRVLPEKAVSTSELSKTELLRVLRVVGKVDLRGSLPSVRARTTVLCGSRDRPNLPAARALAAAIPGATLEIVPGVAHEWNKTHPGEFAKRIARLVG